MSDSVTVLVNKDMEGLVTMGECLEVLEEAFRELGHQIAAVIPRRRIHLPLPEGEAEEGRRSQERQWYWLNVIPGAVLKYDTAAVRLDSAQIRFRTVAGRTRMEFPGDFAGFVLLFSIRDRRLKGIIQDHYVSPLRVGATSGVAAKYMARADAAVVGIFGAGEQARAQVAALCAVRPIRRVKVYSLREDHRTEFAREIERTLDVEAVAAKDPRETVRGSDVVITATNSGDPVFDGTWLEPGTHLVAMIGADRFDQRREIDDATLSRSHVHGIVSIQQAIQDEQADIFDPVNRGVIKWEQLTEIGAILAGDNDGRTKAEQITFYKNNAGQGVADVALGALVLEKAKQKQLGRTLDV